MILRGAWNPSWTLWFPPDVRSVNTANTDPLDKRLDHLERKIVEAILLEEKIVVINCKYLGVREEETRIVERAGVVALRWGVPRLLLVTPEQSRALDRREELCRNWRLWRYQFDPGQDAWVQGSPAKAEALIRRNIEAGLPWMNGLLPDPAQTGQGTKP
jgi:hypothetical protein